MPAKVLIVEDDKLTALGIAEVVTLAGYDVIGSVSSVSEAVDRACVVYPDIAVFDIRLAGRRDGVEGAAILKEMGGAEVVFVSAEQDGETLERARAVQPVALLLQPCHPRRVGSLFHWLAYRPDQPQLTDGHAIDGSADEQLAGRVDRLIDRVRTADAGQPEIEHLHPPVARHHDVRRFEIAVCDLFLMRRAQRVGKWHRQLEELLQRHSA